MIRKLQPAGQEFSTEVLAYSGLALGVLMGAAVSAYWWRQRLKATTQGCLSPLERAEQLIAACEAKLDAIELSVREVQGPA